MMEIIYKPRRMGKTTEVIKRCAEQGGYILVPNKVIADMTFKMAQDMGLLIPFPITALEFQEGKYWHLGVRRLHIDNAELVLQAMSRVPIKTLSLSETRECPNCGSWTDAYRGEFLCCGAEVPV